MSNNAPYQEYLTLSVIALKRLLSNAMLKQTQILSQSKIRIQLKRLQEARLLHNILPWFFQVFPKRKPQKTQYLTFLAASSNNWGFFFPFWLVISNSSFKESLFYKQTFKMFLINWQIENIVMYSLQRRKFCIIWDSFIALNLSLGELGRNVPCCYQTLLL